MEFLLKRKHKLKSLRITVNSAAAVVVHAPLTLPFSKINDFINKKAAWIRKQQEFFLLHAKKLDTGAVARPNYESCKNRARKLVMERLKFLNENLGFEYNRISIKNQRSKWGSCSSAGNLNFNYRILFLPIDLVDYLIVHELCHTRQLNHSRDFWRLVYSILPDAKQRTRELKKYTLTNNF